MPTSDDLYLGYMIESFSVARLEGAPGSTWTGFTACVIFATPDKNTKVVKFEPNILREFAGDLTNDLKKCPHADQREKIERILDDPRRSGDVLDLLSQHPIARHLENRPSAPPDAQIYKESQYVKFIHINIDDDFIKFDFTFLDDRTERFTLFISVAVYLRDSLIRLVESFGKS